MKPKSDRLEFCYDESLKIVCYLDGFFFSFIYNGTWCYLDSCKEKKKTREKFLCFQHKKTSGFYLFIRFRSNIKLVI